MPLLTKYLFISPNFSYRMLIICCRLFPGTYHDSSGGKLPYLRNLYQVCHNYSMGLYLYRHGAKTYHKPQYTLAS